ncbi:hypothetical protein D9M68_939850 [compost metagenome]
MGTILPCAVATTSMWPKMAQSSAISMKAINSHMATRGAGDTGVSCSESAAGRNWASCGRRGVGSISLRRCHAC